MCIFDLLETTIPYERNEHLLLRFAYILVSYTYLHT